LDGRKGGGREGGACPAAPFSATAAIVWEGNPWGARVPDAGAYRQVVLRGLPVRGVRLHRQQVAREMGRNGRRFRL